MDNILTKPYKVKQKIKKKLFVRKSVVKNRAFPPKNKTQYIFHNCCQVLQFLPLRLRGHGSQRLRLFYSIPFLLMKSPWLILFFYIRYKKWESSYHRNVKNQLCEMAKGLDKTLAKLTTPKISDHINAIAENGQDYRIMSSK